MPDGGRALLKGRQHRRLSRHPADHGISLSHERPHPTQPVQIGMTHAQQGLQHIQTGAIGLPFLQRQRIGRLDERGHPRRPILFRIYRN